MKNPLIRDLRVRTVGGLVVLGLLASVVAGREPPAAAPAVVVEPTANRTAGATEDLDFNPALLVRVPREGAIQDLFATSAPQAAPATTAALVTKAAPPPSAAPPTAPAAPPLPFRYLGRLADGEKVTVFLERNQDMLGASPGDMLLDGTYRVDSIADAAVHFTYLPLGTKQVLAVPAPN